MTPNVNVLVAAFRRDHPYGEQARHWLNACPERGYFVSIESESTDTL